MLIYTANQNNANKNISNKIGQKDYKEPSKKHDDKKLKPKQISSNQNTQKSKAKVNVPMKKKTIKEEKEIDEKIIALKEKILITLKKKIQSQKNIK